MSNNSAVWRQNGDTFSPGSKANERGVLPPGVYQYVSTPVGWYLDRTSQLFEFPYKVYGNHDHILDRVKVAWSALSSNLGILLNGTKGSGKTVTAQLLANWAISEGIPVLVVHDPVPLSDILGHLNQDALVIFDEFEKTHAKKENQQDLLTALDGMSRSRYKRLYVFTTNENHVETNFINRPSRIRYLWEFKRLSDETLEELIQDILDPELSHLKASTLKYLKMREVLSIDVVKATLQEINIFREDPSTFEGVMNLSKKEIQAYRLVEILPGGKEKVLNPFFRADEEIIDFLSTDGREVFVQDYPEGLDLWDYGTKKGISMLEPTEDPYVWVCTEKVRRDASWQSKTGLYSLDWLNVDEKPADWPINPEEDTALLERIKATSSLYGTGEATKKFLRIEPIYERVYDFRKLAL